MSRDKVLAALSASPSVKNFDSPTIHTLNGWIIDTVFRCADSLDDEAQWPTVRKRP